MRVGTGYDAHRLVEGRKLILGGVEIPYEKGLDGHSDADVALHAVMDALLGAAAMRDIGYHFPDGDPAYRDISSITLLKEVGEMLLSGMYIVDNIDVTIICQKPKLRPYIDQMIVNIAEALRLDYDQVNVKATTEEGLGFTGSGEGIAAQAICSISSALTDYEDVTPGSYGSPCGGGCGGCGGCSEEGSGCGDCSERGEGCSSCSGCG